MLGSIYYLCVLTQFVLMVMYIVYVSVMYAKLGKCDKVCPVILTSVIIILAFTNGMVALILEKYLQALFTSLIPIIAYIWLTVHHTTSDW